MVAVREKAQKQLRIQTALQIKAQVGFPAWVEVDEKKFTGTFKQLPGSRRDSPGHQREPRRRAVFEVIVFVDCRWLCRLALVMNESPAVTVHKQVNGPCRHPLANS